MGKIYTLGCVIGGESTQISFLGKLYAVDTRKSTYDKIQADSKSADEAEMPDLVVRHGLGGKAYQEIKAQDLPMAHWMELVLAVQAAMLDIPLEEARARFQSRAKN